MTKTEIYEALARGEWRRVEHWELVLIGHIWRRFSFEQQLLDSLMYEVGSRFNPDNWRMRKEDDERE